MINNVHILQGENREFFTADFARILSADEYDVRYWVKCGLLSPSIRKASGQGQSHIFNVSDLRLAFFIDYLHKNEVKPKEIKTVLSEVQRVMDDPTQLVQPMLIPCGSQPFILQKSDAGQTLLLDARRPKQYVMNLALETIEEKVRRALAHSK